MPPHEKHHRRPPAAAESLIRAERLDRLLAPYVPDAADRAFVLRCILDEGPAHHRGTSYVLLALLGRALEAAGGAGPPSPPGPTTPVRMRLPPHLRRERDEEAEFPLRLPLRPLAHLAAPGSAEEAAAVDCLSDGPPHHALANAAMLCLLDALLDRLGAEP